VSNPIWVFVSAFGVSALAGLAALLRSDRHVDGQAVAAHTLNSGILGLGICLLWYSQFRENVHFLVGLCVLAGLGGMATVELVTDAVRQLLGRLLQKKENGDKE
jgi:CHASE2 domain-containing sensor protein